MTPYEFLSTVWRNKAGYGFLCFKPKDAWSGLKAWKEYPLQLPISEAKIEEAQAKYPIEDFDWYFSPCTFSSNKRQARFAQPTDLLWSDVDEGNVNKLGKEPFLLWKTSRGRHAAIWRQDQIVTPDLVEATNGYIAKVIGADPSGKDLSQVLRVVGTINHKPNKGNEVILISSSVNKYNFREETLRGLFLSQDIPDAIIKALGEDVADKDRSAKIYYIARSLFERGFTRNMVIEILKYSKWNKFGSDSKRLEDDVDRVWKKYSTAVSSNINREEEMEGLEAFDLSSIEAEDLSFLWDPYIPEGKITIIEGDPGLGKSWLTMKLAADLSAGRALPGNEVKEPRKVLLLSAEDGLSDTIKPRLSALDANFENIFAVNKPVYITEADMKRIRTICLEKNITVIVIDPLVAFMGGKIDLHKANQTRDIMARLARLGDELGITIICIRHLTKGGKDKAIYRGLGSIDITGAARSVLAIGRDPSNPYSGRVICHIKSNLTKEGLSLLYYIEDKEVPFRWGEFTDDRAQDILAVDLHGHDVNHEEETKKKKREKVAEDLWSPMEEKPQDDLAPIKPEDIMPSDFLVNKGYSWWDRKLREAIKKRSSREDIDLLLQGCPAEFQESLRNKYFLN